MTRNTAKKATAKKTTPRTSKTCAYPDGNRAVAVRQLPGGPRYLCADHALQQRRIGAEVKDL